MNSSPKATDTYLLECLSEYCHWLEHKIRRGPVSGENCPVQIRTVATPDGRSAECIVYSCRDTIRGTKRNKTAERMLALKENSSLHIRFPLAGEDDGNSLDICNEAGELIGRMTSDFIRLLRPLIEARVAWIDEEPSFAVRSEVMHNGKTTTVLELCVTVYVENLERIPEPKYFWEACEQPEFPDAEQKSREFYGHPIQEITWDGDNFDYPFELTEFQDDEQIFLDFLSHRELGDSWWEEGYFGHFCVRGTLEDIQKLARWHKDFEYTETEIPGIYEHHRGWSREKKDNYVYEQIIRKIPSLKFYSFFVCSCDVWILYSESGSNCINFAKRLGAYSENDNGELWAYGCDPSEPYRDRPLNIDVGEHDNIVYIPPAEKEWFNSSYYRQEGDTWYRLTHCDSTRLRDPEPESAKPACEMTEYQAKHNFQLRLRQKRAWQKKVTVYRQKLYFGQYLDCRCPQTVRTHNIWVYD